jgi:hypothetical protein
MTRVFLPALLAVIVCGSLSSCQSRPAPVEITAETAARGDPCTDVAKAIARSDFRLLELRDMGSFVPASDNWSFAIQQKYGTKPVTGSSDTLSEQDDLCVRNYAEIYNRLVIRHIWLAR